MFTMFRKKESDDTKLKKELDQLKEEYRNLSNEYSLLEESYTEAKKIMMKERLRVNALQEENEKKEFELQCRRENTIGRIRELMELWLIEEGEL